jgi:hypothetical protein
MIDRIANTIGELKSSPALLAIVILQAATLAVIYLTASGNAERVHERELALIEACKERAP